MMKSWICFLLIAMILGTVANVVTPETDVSCSECRISEVLFCCGSCEVHYCCDNRTLVVDALTCFKTHSTSLPISTFVGVSIGLVSTFIMALLFHKILKMVIEKLRNGKTGNKDVQATDDPPSYENHEMYRKNEDKTNKRKNSTNIYVLPFESKFVPPPKYCELNIEEELNVEELPHSADVSIKSNTAAVV